MPDGCKKVTVSESSGVGLQDSVYLLPDGSTRRRSGPDDRYLLLEAALHIDAFNGGVDCACNGPGCVRQSLQPLAFLCIEVVVLGYNATSQDTLYSASVEVCQGIR